MNELKRIEKELDEANVPREVWIGTDSTADRVTWLIGRNKLNEKAASDRFDKFAVEFGCLTVLRDNEWLTAAEVLDRLGYGDIESIKLALEYLYQRELIAACNDGYRGNLYAQLAINDGAEVRVWDVLTV